MNEWMKSLSHVRLFATPWNVAYQAPLSMGFSRQEYWSGLPFPSPGDLPNPGIEPRSPSVWADALTSEPPGKPLLSIIWPSNSIPRSLSERTENTCPHKDLVLRTCLIFLLGTKRPQVFFTNYQSLAGPFKNRSISETETEAMSKRTENTCLHKDLCGNGNFQGQMGITWWPSGQDSALSLLRVRVQSLVGEVRSCKPYSLAKRKKEKRREREKKKTYT